MPLEIERRFLVRHDGWSDGRCGTLIRQGYLPSLPGQTLRVRLAGPRAWLTLKTPRVGPTRYELEQPIPSSLAELLLDIGCIGSIIEKTRYNVPYQGLVWEVDVFHGALSGLVITEVELKNPNQPVILPDWAGREITTDRRYSNSSLALHPSGIADMALAA